ncbi:MAG: 1,4-dihydroxy-2-naphthoate octaprenyltransferase [Clostridiales bacterium]|nr:1,4-dihydroxy-2-naphthoate octaprenyltransferase [Clostridiales bacterium]
MKNSLRPKAWIEAARLRTLPVAVAGIVTTLGYNILNDNLNWLPLIICLVFAVLCQIASNFANEYFDYKSGRDKPGRQGPRRGVTEGDITPASMKHAIFITLALAACLGLSLIYWGGWWLIAVGVAVMLGVFAYSTGPFPLSTHGLGEIAVIIFFGIVPVCLTYFVETGLWSLQVLRGGISMGLIGDNVLIVNNYRDIDDDRAVGKHTLATIFGPKTMIALYITNWLGALALMLPDWLSIGTPVTCVVLPLFAIVGVLIAIAMTRHSGASLTKFLRDTSVAMFAYASLFAMMSLLKTPF